MRVGVDQDRHAGARGLAGVDLVEVAAVGRRVDLEHRARAGGRLDHAVDVERVGRALLDLAPGGMADRVDERVLDRGDHAVGHLLRAHPERGVHGGDHPVEALEQLVGVVERAVREDVALGADQDLDALEALVERVDLVDPPLELLRRDVVAEAVRGRVVGDRDVLQPALARRQRHLLGGLQTVRRGRVHVQVALEVGERHQLGQRVLARRLELAAALAQLGRDPRQAEPLVDRLLARAAQRLARFVVEDPVLGDVQAAADRALAQRDVVGLGAREVLEHVAELVGLDDLEVDLHPRVGGHAGARVARGLHGLHELELAERARERLRVAGRGDDVEVLDGVGAAAQRAGHLDPVARGMLAQGGEDLLRDRLGAREHHPWAPARPRPGSRPASP